MKTLNLYKYGDSVRIVKITGDPKTKRRFMDMGITKNTIIDIVKYAPLGDPIELKIRGYDLTIRKNDAKNIIVEEV